MSDERELLELAAKAVFGEFAGQSLEYGWNSLTNDGDALKLAVDLCLIVRCYDYAIIVDGDGIDVIEREIIDKHAATRRAITRGAAEIGRVMK